MHPASHDAAELIRSVVAPFEDELDQARAELAESRAWLEAERSKGLDPETKALFNQAARSPDAPESLRKLGAEVAGGRLTWDDVFAGRGGALGEEFLSAARTTALAQFGDDPVTPVEPPREALATGVDPVRVREDMQQTLVEAKENHDRMWHEGLA